MVLREMPPPSTKLLGGKVNFESRKCDFGLVSFQT